MDRKSENQMESGVRHNLNIYQEAIGSKQLIFLGAHNPEVIRLYKRCREVDPSLELLGFIDNDASKHGKDFRGYPIFGGHEVLSGPEFKETLLVNCITSSAKIRKQTTDQLRGYGLPFFNLIHPDVDLMEVNCGVGLYIQERVVAQAEVTLADHVSIHIGTLIGHETSIGYASFVAHGCVISGCVSIGTEVFIGAGAVIQPRLQIGDGAVIGSGAVVTKDVAPYAVMIGNPAQLLKMREE